MTIQELRDKIHKSGNVDALNSLPCTFENNALDLKIELKGVSAAYEFITQQIAGWKSYGDVLPDQFVTLQANLESKLQGIEELINDYSHAPAHNLTHHWRDLVERRGYSSSSFALYNSPSSIYLIKLYKEFPAAFEGAYDFLNDAVDRNVQYNKDYFSGLMLGYEFVMKDSSALFERRHAEKESIETNKRDFNNFLSEAENQLVQNLRSSKDSYEQYVVALDRTKSEKEKAFDLWFKDVRFNSDTFSEKSTSKIAELEKTYTELLRLKKPAEYWRDRARTLKVEGRIAFGITISLVVGIVVLLYFLLRNPPKEMQESFSSGNMATVKWSIVFVVFVSFMAVLLRVVTKFMYSSFHLSRDAEEREQLVYVYLALRNDSAVDDKDKQIILQSLFSRAESGLLKEESGPTMPTQAIIDKFTK